MPTRVFMFRSKPVSPSNFELVEKALAKYITLPGVKDCEISLSLTESEKIALSENPAYKHVKFNFSNDNDNSKPAIVLKSLQMNPNEEQYGLELAIHRDQSVEQRLNIKKTLDTEIIPTNTNQFSLPTFCENQDIFICIDKNISLEKKAEINQFVSQHANRVTLYEIDTSLTGQASWQQMIDLSTEAKKRNFNRRGIFVAVGSQAVQNIVGVTARTFRRGASSLYYPLSLDDFAVALNLNPKLPVANENDNYVIPFYPATTIVVEDNINKAQLQNVTLQENLPDALLIKEIFNCLNPENDALLTACDSDKLLIVIDKNFYDLHKKQIDNYFATNRKIKNKSFEIIFLEGGDENKNQDALKKIINSAHAKGIKNQAGEILAFGGGVVLDTVGAAAALLDVEYVRVPTTLLGVIDAAVGIKTGINLNAKNDFGAFYKPKAVFYDLDFIKTEPLRNIQSGLAEMIKIFIVTDPASFYVLNEHHLDFLKRDFNNFTSQLIVASIYDMLHQLQPNIYEDKTLERLADFGHEIGHIFEYKSAYRLLHGEAVSLGMAVASAVAYQRGVLKKDELDKILNLLHVIGLPIADELYGPSYGQYIEEKMKDAKANKGGDSAVVAPTAVGSGTFLRDITLEELQNAFAYLNDQQKQFEQQAIQRLDLNNNNNVVPDQYLNTQAQPSIVFDVGGTNLRCGVYLSNGTLVFEARIPTPSIKSMPNASLKEIQQALIDGIKEYVERAKKAFPNEPLDQVIISFAGTLDRGIVLKSASLWGETSNVPLQKMLNDNIPNMQFTLINDVIAAAWRYGTDPYYSQLSNMCIFTLSTGIGAAYFDIGQQNQDKDVISIGHKKKFFDEHSLQCDCGIHGHLEPYVSGRGSLHQAIRAAVDAAISNDRKLFRDSPLFKSAQQKLATLSPEDREAILDDVYVKHILEERHIDEQTLNSVKEYLRGNLNDGWEQDQELIETLACAIAIDNRLLVASINANDSFVEPLFQEIVKYLGEEMYEIAATNTDKIILMGGFARAIKDRFEKAMVQACLDKGIPKERVVTLFSWAENDDNDGILGAAYYGDQPRRLWSLFNRIVADEAKLLTGSNQELYKPLHKAFTYAYNFHTNHPISPKFKFRSDEPNRYFVWHPVELAGEVVKKLSSTDTELITAAFLHDSLEYTQMTAELLEAEFGPKVVNIARDLSQQANLLTMSIEELEKYGYDTDFIAQCLGYDLRIPFKPDQVKAIANIATKIEHYTRLLDNPLDSRSQLLKILDNINNYSSVDRLPIDQVKPRNAVELLLFKIYVDQLEAPPAVKQEAYAYIEKLVNIFGYPNLQSSEMKGLESVLKNDLLKPMREKTGKTAYLTSNKLIHGNDLSDACENLALLKKRNFSKAVSRMEDPNTLPISKNQFLVELKKAFDTMDQSTNNNEEAQKNLGYCAEMTFTKIKSGSLPGQYGRFASNIVSAQLIPADSSIVYYPNDKNPTNLSQKYYLDPHTGKPNVMISAISGSEDVWMDYLDRQTLDEQTQLFYNQNKTLIDNYLKDKAFVDPYESFYVEDRIVPFEIQFPDGEKQALCLFESNASQIVGGQYMFVYPSGLPAQGQTENIITQAEAISKMLDFNLITGKFPPSFARLDPATQDTVENMNPILTRGRSGTTSSVAEQSIFSNQRRHTIGSAETNSDLLPTLDHESSKRMIDNLPKPQKPPISMETNANSEFMFLIGTALNSNYAIFQNSRQTSSIPNHYHCYAVRKDKFLTDGKETYTIPLFNAKANTTLFETPNIKLDKMEWAGTCYRLTIPLAANVKDYAEALDCLQHIQATATNLIPNGETNSCDLTFIANRTDNAVELYIGLRKPFKTNPIPNPISEREGLQSPFNGSLEFAGVNTTKSQDEFNKYLNYYNKIRNEKGLTAAQEALIAVQNESLQLTKPDNHTIELFEEAIIQRYAPRSTKYPSHA